jgi:hypothetical protein
MVMIGASCGADGLAFREDDRIAIITPADREKVRLPLEITWRAKPGKGDTAAPYYAVFVDRAPMPPGRTLLTLVDDSCRQEPGCPSLEDFAETGVHVTETPKVVLETLPDRRDSTRTGARDSHEAVVVLLDEGGRRVGESAWSVEFVVERGS